MCKKISVPPSMEGPAQNACVIPQFFVFFVICRFAGVRVLLLFATFPSAKANELKHIQLIEFVSFLKSNYCDR